MKNLIVLLFLISVSNSNIFGQSVQLDWAMNIGNAEDDEVKAVVHDSIGNTYLAGTFEGTVDFDHGPGITNVSSTPFNSTIISTDIFIVKLDLDGDFMWVKTLGGIRDDEFADMEVDNGGNLMVIGSFRATVDFDLGPNVFNMTASSIGNDKYGFALKIDLNGNFIWAKKIEARFQDVTIDYQNNVIISGEFNGLIDFDPSGGTTYLNSGNINNTDAFLIKLDFSGNFIWAKTFSGIPYDVSSDSQGNIIV